MPLRCIFSVLDAAILDVLMPPGVIDSRQLALLQQRLGRLAVVAACFTAKEHRHRIVEIGARLCLLQFIDDRGCWQLVSASA